jgi:betaine-aldehyde dehydrogenase
MQLELQTLFINGRRAPADSGERFVSLNPATGQPLCQVEQAGERDVERAVAAARGAFAGWAGMGGAARGRILRRAAALLREHRDGLARLEVLDTGKPISEALAVDVDSGADCLDYFAGLAPAVAGEQVDLGGQAFFYTRREPLGVCAGIGAWNYPLQIACWKSAPALACGNTMVFKPSELTPVTASRLAELFIDAGLPPGVFNVVQGDARTGQALVRHPGVAKVSLTGEAATGSRVMADAAATLKQVTLELGGKSPLIVFAAPTSTMRSAPRCWPTSTRRVRSARTAPGSSSSAGCTTRSSTGWSNAPGGWWSATRSTPRRMSAP